MDDFLAYDCFNIPGIVHANIPKARSANVTATALEPSTSSGDKIV